MIDGKAPQPFGFNSIIDLRKTYAIAGALRKMKITLYTSEVEELGIIFLGKGALLSGFFMGFNSSDSHLLELKP